MSTVILPMPEASSFGEIHVNASDEAIYEIVGGQRIEVPTMSAYATRIASRLSFEMGLASRARHLGEVVTETLFRLPLDEDSTRNRRPDVAFVSYERWPAAQAMPQSENAWDVVPDLAVEVISPTDGYEDMIAKVGEYFRAGVRLVWVVLPVVRQVHVFDSPESVRIITDTLDGGAVLPGFQLPLANLLDPPPAAPG